MAITFVQAFGNGAQNKTSGTTLAVNPTTNPTSGHVVAVAFASDDAAGTYSCGDDQGNSWSELVSVTNPGNASFRIFVSLLTTTITGNITVTHPTLTARALVWAEFSGLTDINPDPQTSTATGSVATAPDDLETPDFTMSGYEFLVLGGWAWEGEIETLASNNGNFTGLGLIGTTGGGAASNMKVFAMYVISNTFSVTPNQDVTMSADRDWAAAWGALRGTTSIGAWQPEGIDSQIAE